MSPTATSISRFLICIAFSAVTFSGYSQTTSWRGTSSTAWNTAANWTNGIPTASVDAILGDANFTGAFNPAITATANCRSLTVGGTRNTTLTVNAQLTVSGNLSIVASSTILHTGNTIQLTGNWSRAGTYNATVNTATVVFAGTTQSINNTTTFRQLTINSGSTTALAASIAVNNAFVVSGIFDPAVASNLVTLTGASFTVNALGRIRVHAATFTGNYSVNPALNARSIVEYASASINQTVAVLNYGTLQVSGGTVKTLAGNTTLQSSAATGGNVTVSAGTLNLGTFTLNRNAAGGGTFTVSNGAQLTIGGTNSFPANYNVTTLGASSTVRYGGNNQVVTSKTYGHLILSGTSGNVTKTLPGTSMTIAGDFSLSLGTATSVVCNANAALTITGNVSIGTTTTFNGGSFTHVVAGNWANGGTYNGGTGTVRLNGASRVLSGAGNHNFNNLTIAGVGVTSTATAINVTGNVTTIGSGTFAHNSSGTLTMSGTGSTIGGSGFSFFHLRITGTVSTTASFTIGGNLTVNGTLNATNGTATFNGASATIGGSGATTLNALRADGLLATGISFTLRSNLSGTGKLTATAGTVTFIGTTTVSGTHDLFNATLNGTRLQLGANAALGIAGTLTLTAGTLNTTSTTPNTLTYNGAGNQNITAATYHHLTLAGGGTKTALGATTSRGNLTINTGVTFSASSFTHTVGGNWTNLGTFIPSTSTITFNGASTTALTGATTFSTLTVNKNAAAVTVTLNNNITVTTLNMSTGRMLTGANAVTILGTRTGNAVILGNITRTHTFAPNTAYAFESSFNTITFTGITGGSVTSVTVSTVSAPVLDFPSLNSVSRSYDIGITHTGSYVATLRLHYDDTELNGNTEANLNLWRLISGTWTGLGRTSNSTTNNWVERTGQADITGRWTFYDGSSTHVWKGTTSSAWNTASNWKAGVVPLINDNVLIGTEAFTNQPAVTTSVTVKSVSFGSVQAVTVNVTGAGTLTVNGNIGGDWLADRTHSINVGSRTLNISGDLVLSNGTVGRNINLSVTTGSVSVGGSIFQSGASAIVISGNGNLGIGIDFNFTGGTFTAGTGTVTYNGSGDQLMASGIVYRNLTVSKPQGTATLSGQAGVAGDFTVSGSSNVTLDAELDVTGNVAISPGSTLNANSAVMTVGGNWNQGGAFNPITGRVVFNGAGNQTINQTTFNDLVINKTGGVAAANSNLVINGDLLVTSGSLDLGSFTADRVSPGGTLSIGNGATLLIAGTNFPGNFETHSLAGNSSVVYNGTTQTIAPVTYGNLLLSNTGPKTFVADTVTTASNLTLDAATTLPGTAILKLTGNFVNNATLTAATGSVIEFAGSTTQTVGGTSTTDFGDILISNLSTPGVSIERNQNLRGVLTLAPNTTIDADGSANNNVLRIMSSADSPTQDGAIAAIPSGAAVVGNVTVQRYMSLEGAGTRIYRYVSSPVQNGSVADIQAEIPVTGNFSGTSVCTGCTTAASMFAYDESSVTGGVDDGYTAFPVAANTETLEPGRGYAMYVRGNLLTTALWDLRGTANSGAFNLPVSFTSSGNIADDGWNLVGNPYPSAIDWNSVAGWDKTNISNTIYIRDNSGSGQYATWNGVTGTNGGSQYIATGQAFWVKATGTSPSLSINEAAKAPGIPTSFFREIEPSNLLRVTLAQGTVKDETVIHFRMDASAEFDELTDAVKLPNAGFNLSSQLPGQDKLAINSLGLSECTITVPLSLDNLAKGAYQLSLGNVSSFRPETAITLVDHFAGTTTDARTAATYLFDVTNDPASTGNSRFAINISLQPAPMDYAVAAPPVCEGSDALIELTQVSDMVDYHVSVNDVFLSLEQNTAGATTISLPAGILTPGENNVHVTAVPANGCGIITDKSTTLLVDVPKVPVVTTPAVICNSGATTITASGAGAGGEYLWYESATDLIPVSAGSTFLSPTLTKSQTYHVSIRSSAGCEGERVPAIAEVVYLNDPVISYDGQLLSVNFEGDVQWFIDDQPVVNDTLPFITPAQSGVYAAVVKVNTCSAKATYQYVTTGLESAGQNSNTLYPNPVTDWVHFLDTQSDVALVTIHDISGKMVGSFKPLNDNNRATGKFNMEMLPPGIYFVSALRSSGESTRLKIIKR